MTVDRRCRALAEHFLSDYRLTPEQLLEEADRLAECIQQAVDDGLDSLGLERKR